MPMFVKAGAIIPMGPYALSTSMIPRDRLTIHVYTGSDGQCSLYEDDGRTEEYRTGREYRSTRVMYRASPMAITVGPSYGGYDGAPESRIYQVDIHGLSSPPCLEIDGVAAIAAQDRTPGETDYVEWNSESQVLSVYLHRRPVSAGIKIEKITCGKHQ
jgi:hypothetical protein